MGLEDMALADLAALEDLGLGVPNQGALADRVGLGRRALAPEARDLSLGLALLDPMPAALGLALLDPMPAALGRTRPADRLWAPTTPVEAMRLAERTRRVAAIHLVAATRRVAATHLAEATQNEGHRPAGLTNQPCFAGAYRQEVNAFRK